MCGLTGFLQSKRRLDEVAMAQLAGRMADRLVHRGPDGSGVWVDADAGVALGHRRLSILDLSVEGAQPMRSHCGRYVLVYNGEVYNFRALRRELEGADTPFRGNSDTEVLLAALSNWGIEATLPRLEGMFAFALWDRRERCLSLARDPVGKKPLYYGWCRDGFLFGSELDALRVHPDFDAEVDRDALGLFLRYSWISAPRSIYRRIRKLEPGSWLRVSLADSHAAEPRRYWCADDVATRAESEPFRGSFDDATDQLDALLGEVVGMRMVADVPLGALLSGGVDSSTVVSLMQAQSDTPVQTFSIGFDEESHDEAAFARAVAQHLGTDHHELTLTAKDALEWVPQMPSLYDEPFADASQIPTAAVAQLARGHVTVALSGDGGDELFWGYRRYRRVLRHWDAWGRVPSGIRRVAGRVLGGAARGCGDWLGRLGQPEEGESPTRMRALPGTLERFAGYLQAEDPRDLFAIMNARCGPVGDLVLGAREVSTRLTDPDRWPNIEDPIRFMMAQDFAVYIPDCIQVKVDRASMGVGLEVRCPLLDPRLLAFAWSLPRSHQMEDGRGKRVLRQVLARYVPPALTDRPKRGFGVPIAAWLRGPLRGWAEALLDPARVRREGVLNSHAVGRIWNQHLSGRFNHEKLLWHLLMFQAWRESR